MKKIVVSIMAIAALTAIPVSSEADISVTLNGQSLEFDVPPQIIDGRTLVPLRAIFEALGAEVDWNGETQTVTAQKEDTQISMTISDNVMKINSRAVTLDVPPQIIDDRTLVPARAAAEGFGADVGWDESTRTVIITTENTTADSGPTEIPVPTVTPVPEETSVPTATPVPTEAPAAGAATVTSKDFPITYNSEPESRVGYASRFSLTSVKRNAEGNYDIEFEVFTFLEGRGDVGVSFKCLDENGREVDTFAGLYRGTDYTWSKHNDKATISGKTVQIELIPAEK